MKSRSGGEGAAAGYLDRGLAGGRLAPLLRSAEEIRVGPGAVMMSEDRIGRWVFIVGEGVAEVTRRGRKLADLGPGDIFGEIAVIDPGPRTATVTSVSTMRLWRLGLTDFDRAMAESRELRDVVVAGLAKRLRAVEEMLEP